MASSLAAAQPRDGQGVIPAGSRRIEALVGDRRVDINISAFYRGQTHTWYVSAPKGSVRVANRRAHPINVNVDGARKATLQPGEEQTLAGISAGDRTLAALTYAGAVFKVASLKVRPGETRLWAVQ